MGTPSHIRPSRRNFWLIAVAMLCGLAGIEAQTPATTVPLLLPGGLAYDAQGNLYFAETANHVVRRVSVGGVLTTVAGNGLQGFAGDGGAATAAELDSPSAVALDAAGDLFIADAHNHRIRRVDAVSGVITAFAGTGVAALGANGLAAALTAIDLPIALAFNAAGDLFFADARTHVVRRIDHASGVVTTVAGSGVQGYAGDGGLATLAAIDTPSGIALDAADDLFLSDAHNHRVRRVDAATGIITTTAGTGQPGFAGDAAAAAKAALDLPRGLVMDSGGNLFIVDSRNQRIRRVDATTGQISTIAGDGTQGFAGDGSAAVAASLNTPRAVALSPTGLATLADASNERVRQVDAAANIHTIAGLSTATAETLTLAGPSTTVYGTGTLVATLNASAASGAVMFLDTVASGTQTLTSVPLASNAASLSMAMMAAGTHRVSAKYAGDASHAAAQSDALGVSVSPAPLVATPASASVAYGLAIPTLTGTLSGVLPQDVGAVTAQWSSGANALSPPGAYPIGASIAGAAAGNYTLTQTTAALTITQAVATITLSNALAVHVASTTAGTPTGQVRLLDAGTLYATATLSATGDAAFSSASLSTGSHTLTAIYAGDADFLAVTSSPVVVTIGTAGAADFTLASTGPASVTIPAGSSAAFSFAVQPVNGALASPTLLTASGLPSGATASFNPAYLPPSGSPATFVMTIQTLKTARLELPPTLIYAALLLVCFRRRKMRKVLLLGLAVAMMGCGDRINTSANVAVSRTYNVTVIGTATSATGATLQHTVVVTLTLQ